MGEKPTTAGGSDGKITGVKENMEYRKSGTDSYIACTGTEITGLSAGTYEVRYKGDTNHEESPAFVVTVRMQISLFISWKLSMVQVMERMWRVLL